MTKIGLISDTHSYLDENVFYHFKDCDQILHAGDFGSLEVVQKLRDFKPLIGVYGNIDGKEIQQEMPLDQILTIENVKIFMRHIGGYPGHYAPGVKNIIKKEKPKLFISGHSHILKVMHDPDFDCMHMNPGAAGREGWHKMRTLLKFDVDDNILVNLQIIELGPKNK